MTKFVEKYDQMNPETEFLISSGYLLQNGMEVLLADPNNRTRVDLAKKIGDWEYDQALERNRWCKVSYLKYDHENKVYRFVGTYGDGTQRLRVSEQHQPWLVKFDSVDVLQQTRNAVKELVAKAMIEQDAATYHGNSSSPDLMTVRASITDDILKIFGMGVSK